MLPRHALAIGTPIAAFLAAKAAPYRCALTSPRAYPPLKCWLPIPEQIDRIKLNLAICPKSSRHTTLHQPCHPLGKPTLAGRTPFRNSQSLIADFVRPSSSRIAIDFNLVTFLNRCGSGLISHQTASKSVTLSSAVPSRYPCPFITTIRNGPFTFRGHDLRISHQASSPE